MHTKFSILEDYKKIKIKIQEYKNDKRPPSSRVQELEFKNKKA
jgi:hypothetical protein